MNIYRFRDWRFFRTLTLVHQQFSMRRIASNAKPVILDQWEFEFVQKSWICDIFLFLLIVLFDFIQLMYLGFVETLSF